MSVKVLKALATVGHSTVRWSLNICLLDLASLLQSGYLVS